MASDKPMAASAQSISESYRTSRTEFSHWKVLTPYLVAFASQIPMLVIYFRDLWSRPHYSFFPLAIVAMGVLTYWRWPRKTANPFQRSSLGTVALMGALLYGLGAVLFVDAWFSAFCVFLLLVSLYSRIVDSETGGSQVAISLLFLICIIPPFGLDNWLITWLQQVSARITSQLLDLVGYAHYMPGTVIEAPGSKGFGIEEACSGVQSFFTLLFVALLYVVYYRRPWFRASLLLASVAFWSVFMNTMRIFVIPIAERVADWDLSKDLAHDILGYTALIIGMLLLYSTDQFLLFLFGPAEDFSDDAGGLSRSVTRFWNRFASGANQENRRKKTKKSLNQSAFVVLWAIAGLLAVGGLFSLTDVYKSLNTPGLKVQFFDSSVLVPLEKDAIPAEIEDWRQVNYTYQDRSRGSDLGQYSDTWIFVAPKFGLATASLDQAFPGWHELTTCYKNQGWELIDRKVFAGTREGSDVRWPYVEAEFRNKLGQHGFLVFSLFDGMGDAYEPPSNWSAITYLVNGVSNRMNNRVRSRLFRGEAYQTQTFVSTYREFDRELKDHIVERYMTIRDLLREDFLKKSGTLSGNNENGSPSGPIDAVEPTT